jgi:hypothetical protein
MCYRAEKPLEMLRVVNRVLDRIGNIWRDCGTEASVV